MTTIIEVIEESAKAVQRLEAKVIGLEARVTSLEEKVRLYGSWTNDSPAYETDPHIDMAADAHKLNEELVKYSNNLDRKLSMDKTRVVPFLDQKGKQIGTVNLATGEALLYDTPEVRDMLDNGKCVEVSTGLLPLPPEETVVVEVK